MTILLLILKIIGILLLAILGIFLLLLALVLFVPLRYRVEGSEGETRRVAGKLHWLLHAVSVSFSYQENRMEYSLRIFGLSMLPRKKKTSALEDTDFEDDTDLGKDTDFGDDMDLGEDTDTEENTNLGENRASEERMDLGENGASEKRMDLGENGNFEENADLEKAPEEPQESLREDRKKVSGKNVEKQAGKGGGGDAGTAEAAGAGEQRKKTPGKKVRDGNFSRLASLKQLFQNLADIKKIFTDEANQKSVSLVWRELRYLLRHSGFRKIKTDLTFSLGDPAATGQILGVLCMFPVLYRYEVNVSPDFEGEHIYIRGNYFIKGHIRLLHFLLSGIRLWKEKEFRRFVTQILKKLER